MTSQVTPQSAIPVQIPPTSELPTKPSIQFCGRKITPNPKLTCANDAKFSTIATTFLDQKCETADRIRFAKDNITVIKEIITKNTEGNLDSALSLLRMIYEDTLKLSSTSTISESNLDHIENALGVLAHIDDNSYLIAQYNTLLAQCRAKKKVAPNIALVAISTFSPIGTTVKSAIDEKEMIQTLDQLLLDEDKGEGKEPVQREQTNEKIQEFLIYAYGNNTLNKNLKQKQTRTPAEEFLYEYTFATTVSSTTPSKQAAKLGASQLRTSINKLKGEFKKHNLTKICESLREIEELERALYGHGTQLAKSGDENVKAIATEIKGLFKLYEGQNVWEVRRGTSLLEQAKSILGKIQDLPHEQKESCKAAKESLTSLQKNILTNRGLDEFLANNNPPELGYLTLSNLKRYDALSTILRPLAEKCGQFAHGSVLRAFVKDCEEAEDLMYDLRLLAEVTTAHQPGDIALEDEALYKKFNNSSSIPFSQPHLVFSKSPIKTLSNIKKLIDDICNKGFWALAAFTGPKHARMFFPATIINRATVGVEQVKVGNKKKKKTRTTANGSECVLSETKHTLIEQKAKEVGDIQKYLASPNIEQELKTAVEAIEKEAIFTASVPRTIEITGSHGANFNQIAIEQSLYELHYRPDFDKILTTAARAKEDVTKESVMQIYQKKLQEVIEGESKFLELHKYQIDPARAAASTAMSWLPNIGPLKLKLFARDLIIFLFGDKGLLRPLLESRIHQATSITEAKNAVSDANKRFCSELVSEITKAALAATESALVETHGMLAPGTTYLNKVFPEEVDLSEIYPGKLKNMISKSAYFTAIDPPKVLTQLFGKIDE